MSGSFWVPKHGFPQVLQTLGGAHQNLMEGGLQSKHGGSLKMLSKNTCDGVHLIVKLQAISLQPSKFTKNELHTYFSRILARF